MNEEELEELWEENFRGQETVITFAIRDHGREGETEVWLPTPDEIDSFRSDPSVSFMDWIIDPTEDFEEWLSDYWEGFRNAYG